MSFAAAGVAVNSGDDVCECGHTRDEHDGAGCFSDPETCQCERTPGLLPGEPDTIAPKPWGDA